MKLNIVNDEFVVLVLKGELNEAYDQDRQGIYWFGSKADVKEEAIDVLLKFCLLEVVDNHYISSLFLGDPKLLHDFIHLLLDYDHLRFVLHLEELGKRNYGELFDGQALLLQEEVSHIVFECLIEPHQNLLIVEERCIEDRYYFA